MSIAQMAKTVVKNLVSNPATQMYPYKKRAFYQNTRGSISIQIQDCIFCGLCQRKCPTGALEVLKPNKEWVIQRSRCIMCNACVEVCPKDCLTMETFYSNAYTAAVKESYVQAEVTSPNA